MLELVGLESLAQPEEGAEADDEAEELMEEREAGSGGQGLRAG